MNKILIVGHPHSGYQDVERQLGAWGLQAALPARREGYSPEQITKILCQAHGVKPIDSMRTSKEVNQVEPAPLWQGVALDLLLSNLNQNFWGWGDPQALHLLNFWRDVDPELTFLLVYDSPQSVLARSVIDQQESLTQEATTEGFRNWVAYNEALLHFYNRNRQRCVLIHRQQVSEKPGEFLKLLSTYVNVPASPSTERLTKFGLKETHQVVTNREGTSFITGATPILSEEIFGYLSDAIVSQDPVSLRHYEELQATADLPLTQSASSKRPALEIWNIAKDSRRHVQQLTSELDTKLVQNEQLSRKLTDLDQQVKSIKQRGDALETELKETANLREQLERDVSNKQSQISSLQTLTNSQFSEIEEAVAAARQAEDDTELKQENELLLAQLHQVQEELERYFLENEDLKKSLSEAKSSKVVSLPGIYGAADRVKQQLPYRLGATMIARSNSLRGLLGIPWALRKEAGAYRQASQEKLTEYLPPIEQYRDAYKAERVKRHLSYRLGTTIVTKSKTPMDWVKLPFAIRNEIRDFRRERKAA